MQNEDWTFPEEPWKDVGLHAVKFVVIRNGERYVCAISSAALNDKFRTEDTLGAALENYRAHADWVHGIAIRLIETNLPNHPDGYFIDSALAKRMG